MSHEEVNKAVWATAPGFLCAGAVWHPHFLYFVLEVLTIAKLDHQLNEEIRDKEVRVIGPDGTMLGIMSAADALKQAEEQDYDLVKISPNAVPPVCKIMDYGKFRFEQMKKEKEAKKNQHVVEIKEIRMSPGIDTNDFNVKVKNAMKFLKDGNRVKVTVRFRGREMAHTNIGEQLLVKFGQDCAESLPTWKRIPSWTGVICRCSCRRRSSKGPRVFIIRKEKQHAETEDAQRCEKKI